MNESIASPEDSPAVTLVLPETEPVFPDLEADYGPNSSDSFLKYDQFLSLWKTYQGFLFQSTNRHQHPLEEYLGTWPRAGLMRNGMCFRHPCSERPIFGKGYLSLPTPTHLEWKDIGEAC